jgi:protein-S-isoprenylcysteine O-methyltransferase Ste14
MNAVDLCGYLWTAWLVVWLIWAFRSKHTKQRESLGSRMSYTIPVWAAVYCMFGAKNLGEWWHRDILLHMAWLGPVGVAITAFGFAFTFWARYILGGNWSGAVTIKVGHELIRTGPYGWVRHPIYTGMIIATTGTAIALDQWRGVVAAVLMWLGFTIKRLKEEQFMRQTFGDQYTDYTRTTGAIFPSLLRRNG